MSRRRKPAQPELNFRTWGGTREGAGRKAGPGRRKARHRAREALRARVPLHVTVRFAVSGMRRGSVNEAIREVLMRIHSSDAGFRVLAYSLLGNHLHLIVEGDSAAAFARGLRALPIRIGKRVNSVLGRRGRLFAERHHRQALATPAEVRNAFAYVLLNRRKHAFEARGNAGAEGVDPYSSGEWFDGWKRMVGRPSDRADGPPVVARARWWLAGVGWRKRGLIDPGEIPSARRSEKRSEKRASARR